MILVHQRRRRRELDIDEGGRRGERATGTANTIYDLASVLFHSLEGGASYDQYIRDAEEAGDEELVDFFTRVRDEDSMRADEAQRLLAERTPPAGPSEGAASRRPTERVPDELPPVAEPSASAPRTEDVAPTRAGEVPPTPGEPPPRTEEDRGLYTKPERRSRAKRSQEEEKKLDHEENSHGDHGEMNH